MSFRILSFAIASAAFVACTGGGGAIGGGGSSSGGSSSGSTSSSGSGSSSGGTGTTCTELVMGGTNDPGLGGSAVSQVIAQTVSDFAATTTKQIVDLTAACKDLAVALDATSNQAAAEAQTDPRAKMDAWCKLAVTGLGTAKAMAGGTMTVQFDPSACPLSVQEKASCQGRCARPPPPDHAAFLAYPLTRVVSPQAMPFQEIAEALAFDARERGRARDVGPGASQES